MADWKEPKNLEDAVARRNRATEALFSLDAELAGLKTKAHTAHRARLIADKAMYVTEVRRLKAWIHNKHVSIEKDTVLLQALYKLIMQLQKDGVELDSPELALVKQLKARLNKDI